MYTAAVLSQNGVYRYELSRRWSSLPVLGWVMLNPSTADASIDDPTIRRCMGFARRWGFGGIVVRNLFALRARHPRQLRRHADPIGPDNDSYLARCGDDDLTVLAWGAAGGDRGRRVQHLFHQRSLRLCRLAVTKSGQPAHPLYLRADLVPVPVVPEPAQAGNTPQVAGECVV
jgi:hypothetical protein